MINKKLLSTAIIAGSLISHNAIAENKNSTYAGISLGVNNYNIESSYNGQIYSESTSGLSLKLYTGYNMSLNENLSFMPELGIDLGGIEYSLRDYMEEKLNFKTSGELSFRTKLKYNLTSKISPNITLGYSTIFAKSRINDTVINEKSLMGNSLLFGLGLGYKIKDNLAVNLNYEKVSYDFQNHSTTNYNINYNLDINKLNLTTSYFF